MKSRCDLESLARRLMFSAGTGSGDGTWKIEAVSKFVQAAGFLATATARPREGEIPATHSVSCRCGGRMMFPVIEVPDPFDGPDGAEAQIWLRGVFAHMERGKFEEEIAYLVRELEKATASAPVRAEDP